MQAVAHVNRHSQGVNARRSRRGKRARHGRLAGLTLIEIMVVVVIVALGATGVSVGLGALTRTSLRSACVRLAALSRYAYHRALTKGTTVRLSLDFETGAFTLTEAHGRVALVRSDTKLREEAARAMEEEQEGDDDAAEQKRDDPGAAIDAWEAARLKLEQPDTLVFPPSPFQAITTPSGKAMERFSGQPIGDDVRFAKVIVSHEAEPREEGIVDLFFFPSGLAQHAVIQLVDRNDVVYSVEIHPLSGRTTVYDAPYEPEVIMDDPTERDERASELEDN
jgi:prepilin-type N-terminal cleavage/methylation domain-containing protein